MKHPSKCVYALKNISLKIFRKKRSKIKQLAHELLTHEFRMEKKLFLFLFHNGVRINIYIIKISNLPRKHCLFFLSKLLYFFHITIKLIVSMFLRHLGCNILHNNLCIRCIPLRSTVISLCKM